MPDHEADLRSADLLLGLAHRGELRLASGMRLGVGSGVATVVVLVSIETLLLVLLLLLVAGLLRSHAEILRSLGRLGAGVSADGGLPSEDQAGGVREAFDVMGATLDGEELTIRVAERPGTLLAFLTSGCSTCKTIWRQLSDRERSPVPGGARVVVVAKDRREEAVSRLRRFAPTDLPLVLSSEAWESYRVPGAPYFVYVDEYGVRGEGSADGWDHALSFVEDALGDIAEEEALVSRIAAAAGQPERGRGEAVLASREGR